MLSINTRVNLYTILQVSYTWKMYDVIDEKGRFNECDKDHEHCRRVTGELLGVGESFCDAL
jgi:hypothetical protein